MFVGFSWPAQRAEIPPQGQSENIRKCFLSLELELAGGREGCVESPKGSGIVGRDNCMDSEHFDPVSSQMLNLLRFITLFTLNRSTL